MFFNILGLLLVGLQGYFFFYIFKMNHMQMALWITLIYLFSQSFIYFFIIAFSKAIRQSMELRKIEMIMDDNFIKVKIKMHLHFFINMLLVMSNFLLGGAVHNNLMSGTIHGLLFFILFFEYIWLCVLQHKTYAFYMNSLKLLD